jgi:hypothetical protein
MKIKNQNNCCKPANQSGKRGILSGVFYGLLPHAFCIGFIIFSVIGAGMVTAVFKKFLLIPYFFHFLVIISFLMATLSAAIYLKKNKCLCAAGIKNKWKYLAMLYSVTVLTNLLMFSVVFPALANANPVAAANQTAQLADLSIKVQIPCSGHAPLIIDELKKDGGVGGIKFELPDIFEIKYDAEKTSPQEIISLEIFKTYKATIE